MALFDKVAYAQKHETRPNQGVFLLGFFVIALATVFLAVLISAAIIQNGKNGRDGRDGRDGRTTIVTEVTIVTVPQAYRKNIFSTGLLPVPATASFVANIVPEHTPPPSPLKAPAPLAPLPVTPPFPVPPHPSPPRAPVPPSPPIPPIPPSVPPLPKPPVSTASLTRPPVTKGV